MDFVKEFKVVASPKGDSVSVGFSFPALPCRALD
jgi:hypothetical protein